jgi:hypothetical protein
LILNTSHFICPTLLKALSADVVAFLTIESTKEVVVSSELRKTSSPLLTAALNDSFTPETRSQTLAFVASNDSFHLNQTRHGFKLP